MSDALLGSAPPLTNAQRRLLWYLEDLGGTASLSSRRAAAALDLSRATVQTAFARLNDLGYIKTQFGKSNRPGVHAVLIPGPIEGAA